jgi:hypothetical protein
LVRDRRSQRAALAGQGLLDALEHAGIDEGRVLTWMDLVAIAHLAEIGHVAQ